MSKLSRKLHRLAKRQKKRKQKQETARSKAESKRESRAVRAGHAENGQKPVADKKPKYDLGKGRSVYAVKDARGKTVYVPKESEATDAEREHGLFVKDSSVDPPAKEGREAVKGGTPRIDLGKDRNVYPVKNDEGKTIYLPKESEATDAERERGLFVKDSSVDPPTKEGREAIKDGTPRKDLGKGRDVYPVKKDNGNTIYLPRESDATDFEKANGLFVKDSSVTEPPAPAGREALKDKKPRYDQGKGRYIYPAKDEAGNTRYLPRASEATDDEKERGLFVRDEEVDTPEEKWTPVAGGKPKYDQDKGRYVYPVKDADGHLTYLPAEGDATEYEKEHQLYLPDEVLKDPEAERRIPETPERLTARAERTQRLHPPGPIPNREEGERMLYPNTRADGEVVYLPQQKDATAQEIADGRFISDKEAGLQEGKPDLSRKPFSEALDGTQLWDGQSLPPPTEVQHKALLRSLKPTFDPENGRMLYPVEGDEVTQYLPLAEDATAAEIIDRTYARFTTEQPIEDFVLQNVGSESHEVEGGTITAVAMENLADAFTTAPLKLTAHRAFQEQLENTNTPAQQWVG
ncbi:hypothetical protein LVD15_00840 [Fulvivirga maritima]|uniref:hypothetical protein n=1 Tax=Fulvivirga maritima TaxID=2904247 RepID=UPI001F41860A|nr:hypothetical protein [Fulvivirga maritima]UII27015.1 hypothetical protein LVD15_00840 [Fulvivirga maritima]